MLFQDRVHFLRIHRVGEIARGELLRRRLQRLELAHGLDDEVQPRGVQRDRQKEHEEAACRPCDECAEKVDQHHGGIGEDALPCDGQRENKTAHGAVNEPADDINDAVFPPLSGAEAGGKRAEREQHDKADPERHERNRHHPYPERVIEQVNFRQVEIEVCRDGHRRQCRGKEEIERHAVDAAQLHTIRRFAHGRHKEDEERDAQYRRDDAHGEIGILVAQQRADRGTQQRQLLAGRLLRFEIRLRVDPAASAGTAAGNAERHGVFRSAVIQHLAGGRIRRYIGVAGGKSGVFAGIPFLLQRVVEQNADAVLIHRHAVRLRQRAVAVDAGHEISCGAEQRRKAAEQAQDKSGGARRRAVGQLFHFFISSSL